MSPMRKLVPLEFSPKCRRRIRSRTERQSRRSSLLAEQLESRVLLAVVTSTDPIANTYDAPLSANVSATFDEAINAATATSQNFVVRSEMRTGTEVVSAAGMTITSDPSTDFFAGERVEVTATGGIQGAGSANTPYVWQFRAGAPAGSGQFTDSGQVIGPNAIVRSDRAAFGDIDGDGDLDSFIGTRIWTNDGGGVFTDSGQALAAGGEEPVFGDVDGDSDLDLLTHTDIFINNGSGVFSSGQSLGGSSGYNAANAVGDVDGDGDLDIMQGNTYGANLVFLNNGSGSFTNSGQNLTTLGGTDSIKFGDFDGDGDLDAFEAINGGGNRTWTNDGSGVFTPGLTLGGFTGTKDIDVGDVDGDGDVDLLVVNNDEGSDTSIRIWVNDGGGTFTNSGQAFNTGATNWAGEFGDVDADGDLDFVTSDRVNRATVWLNDGNGTFNDSGQNLTFGDPGVSRRTFGIALGDVDGDGDLDFLEANQSSGGNRLWLNQNLQPSVTIGVDTTSIAEAAGVATVTASLSATHGQDVTVNLGFSGTATENADYTVSSTQIVIAAGALSGFATVTAVQDAGDEPDETITVDITNVTNGQESGTQQVAITIVDDDEPVMPDVTLSVNNESIAEAGGVATFTATLSEVAPTAVTVELTISGSATEDDDFSVSATEIVIAAGATTGAVTVTAVDDDVDEPDETVVIEIASVIGGNESGEQQATTTITDDDNPPSFAVSRLTPTASGFVAELTSDLDPSDLNIYDTQNLGVGAADVVLVGASSGPVAGSLVIDPSLQSVTFIKSGDPLAADAYTVTLRSGADAFKDAGGRLLDGNGDGTEGDNFSGTFEVAAPAAGTITVSVPDFTRGPGQEINLPANTENGIPVTISDGAGVRAIDMRIGYDPAKLSITGATVGASMPAGATVIVNTGAPGLAILVFFSSTALPSGSNAFVNLQASVPAEDAGDVYGSQQVLDLHGVTISDGNDNESPVLADDAFQLARYFSDVSGNGRVNAADASQVARFAALIDSGFSGSLSADPIVAGDVSGNGRINAADASLVAQFAALIDVPVIPPIPGGIALSGLPTTLGVEHQAVAAAESSEAAFQGRQDESTFVVLDVFSSSNEPGAGAEFRAIDEALTSEESFLSSLEELIENL